MAKLLDNFTAAQTFGERVNNSACPISRTTVSVLYFWRDTYWTIEESVKLVDAYQSDIKEQ